MVESAREKLVGWLERRAFDPVLRAKPGDYPESKRAKLADVQRRTRSERERFRHYGSAQEVVVNFKRDLRSEPAQKVHRALEDLGLPTLNALEDEFERLAAEVGEGSGGSDR
ncbi:MAG TPA: hypothetical protein VHA77_13225 [Xanthobacteraceae bacterium]|nr:hypothetical protein [Xanthobacteraceae bacterium]